MANRGVCLMREGRILGPAPLYFFATPPSLVPAALQVVGSLARVQVPGIGIAPVRHTLDLLGPPPRLPKLTLFLLTHQLVRAGLGEEAAGTRLSPQILPFGSLREDEPGLFKPEPAPALLARALLGHAPPSLSAARVSIASK